MPSTRPETRYAKSGDLNIAYQVTGDGRGHSCRCSGTLSECRPRCAVRKERRRQHRLRGGRSRRPTSCSPRLRLTPDACAGEPTVAGFFERLAARPPDSLRPAGHRSLRPAARCSHAGNANGRHPGCHGRDQLETRSPDRHRGRGSDGHALRGDVSRARRCPRALDRMRAAAAADYPIGKPRPSGSVSWTRSNRVEDPSDARETVRRDRGRVLG